MDNKKHIIIVSLAIVVIIFVFLLSSIVRINKTPPKETTASSESFSETISKQEIEAADKINEKTSFWYWEGEVSGEVVKEYLTLRGDDTCILIIELDQHDPVDEVGTYTIKRGKDYNTLYLSVNEEMQKGTITNQYIKIGGKIYKRTSCDHV